ncbi:hypothetical protein NEIG_01728 [Nematocida sp. ERTm5]|nr:hypothetical protein NEIG_01728 [Nematocida sp. ERTm5]
MKLQYLICIIFACQVYARLALSQLEHLQKMIFVSSAFGEQRINQNGPLIFLPALIYHKSGYMHNKRLFSPEIKTDYSLTKNPKKNMYDQNSFTFTRKPNNDKVYFSINEDTNSVYLSEYHKRIIQMFPSSTGDLSIEAGRYNAFTQFLRSSAVLPHASDILASLFLLSEGVDILLSWNDNEKTLTLHKTNGDMHFNISMVIKGYKNIQSKKLKNIYQSEVKEIIDFFIERRNKPSLHEKKASSVPTSFDEFKKGRFLDSLEFLIQMYIFEFIDSIESAENIIRAIHTMLLDYITNGHYSLDESEIHHAQRVLEKCFVPNSAKEALDYIQSMKDVYQIIYQNRATPFYDSSLLPGYTRVPYYNRKTNSFSKKCQESFSNCGEAGIFALFCCFTYDPVENIYTTAHIPGASPELKSFFKKYDIPEECISAKHHKEWCRVVSDLAGPIDYVCPGNEINAGILNMLSIICTITNYSDSSLIELKKKIANTQNEESELYEILTEFIKDLFTQLSFNKSVVVSCRNLNLGNACSERTDVFGYISLNYTYKNIQNTVQMHLSRSHSEFSALQNTENQAVTGIDRLQILKNKYVKEKAFTGYLLANYINRMIENIMKKDSHSYLLANDIISMTLSDIKHINGLFLLKKIEGIEYKKEIVSRFLFYMKSEDIHSENRIIRMTSNILGSVPLNDKYTQIKMLSAAVYTMAYKTAYTNIQLEEQDTIGIIEYTMNTLHMFSYILDANNPTILLAHIKEYIKRIGYFSNTMYNPLISMHTSRRIFNCLFSNNQSCCAENGFDIIDMLLYIDEETASFVSFIWFHYACEEMPDQAVLIIELFKCIIDFYSVCDWRNFLLHITNIERCKIRKTLDTLKSTLCTTPDNTEKYQVICNILRTAS